jgi:4-alpha-glucanotransferase
MSKAQTVKNAANLHDKNLHGINLPLSCLRSSKSSGIGEFLDLLPLIDWCKETSLNVIQLLPLNDTGDDPSPYNPLSSCALNPIYLSLHALPYLEKYPDLKSELTSFLSLNNEMRVSYSQVQNKKLLWLKKYIEHAQSLLTEDPEYYNFISQHSWVEPYALFKTLKARVNNKSWLDWPKEIKTISQTQYKALCERYSADISFYLLLQYLATSQLKQVKAYAASKGVFIKGDISILISPDSADCYFNREQFDFSLAAGAPPDVKYNADGQYWGFPLFNWEKMKELNYAWWKERLQVASSYYDLYRIDHAMGFFRIWAIPLNRPATEGKYLPENSSLWIKQGKEILQELKKEIPMLAVSEDIPIGEDAEEVMPAIQACLAEIGICGTKLMRYERKKDGSFIPSHEYPASSMTCLSNHDFEPLSLWWKNFPDDAKILAKSKKWNYSSKLTYTQRMELLSDCHKTPSLLHINLLQEYLALFDELVWPEPEDERINIPGTILPTNWTYRCRTTLEEIIIHKGLKEAVIKIIS